MNKAYGFRIKPIQSEGEVTASTLVLMLLKGDKNPERLF